MKTARLLSALSAATIAATTTMPAFAYIYPAGYLMPAQNELAIDDGRIPAFGPFSRDPGSAFRVNRQVTSRAIRSDRNQNRPDAGNIRVYGGERDEAVASIGREHLPVRAAWRRPGLRNQNRHILGLTKRGGQWRAGAQRYTLGDPRRSPDGLGNALYGFPARLSPTLAKTNLPPSIVQAGASEDHPNWRRWARGRNDTRGMRDINLSNRR